MGAEDRLRARKAGGARLQRAAAFSRFILHSLTRGNRLGVALAAIVVGSAIVTALTSLYFDISIKMSEELRAFGPNVIVSPKPDMAAAARGERGTDAKTLRDAIADLPRDRLVGGTPYLFGLVRLDLGNAVLVGADLSQVKAISPFWQVDGSWISVDFDERNALVGSGLAKAMELTVGKPVTIRSLDGARQARVTVKGIVETGENEDSQIFVNLALAQRLLDLPRRADFAMASVVAQGPEADAMTSAMTAKFPVLDARPIRKVSQADGQILDKIEGLMALVAAIILVITTLSVNATLTAMVAERAPQIGLQKAIGASNRIIVAQILAETAIICLVATAIGLALGFLLAQLLGQAVFGAWVSFRPVVLPLTLGLSLVAALVAAALPVRGAVNVVPARVLRGE
ncbi:ABC transporter permease [Rhodomicrobium sp.]|uniref:ABC transporter permease n=1 Tax=Rhodomicrobium sp. TaxID=2720632 RepID=UPI0039E710C2